MVPDSGQELGLTMLTIPLPVPPLALFEIGRVSPTQERFTLELPALAGQPPSRRRMAWPRTRRRPRMECSTPIMLAATLTPSIVLAANLLRRHRPILRPLPAIRQARAQSVWYGHRVVGRRPPIKWLTKRGLQLRQTAS